MDTEVVGGPTGGVCDSGPYQPRDGAPDVEKNQLKPWLKECWCLPPQGSSDFVCAMEDVLEVYHRSYEDKEVLVCLDETSKQLVGETRQSRPPRPGSAMAYDYEYQRNGVSNLFMLFAPLEGWRRVEVTDRRTRADWARVVKRLVDQDYPDRERIVLVMDNLNTHHPASLYEAFEPAEARRIAERLEEIHYTPKHGSWLNMAEIEIGVLDRQCLDRRTPSQEIPEQETGAWEHRRNRQGFRVDWRFTTEDARIKLKSLSHQVKTDGLRVPFQFNSIGYTCLSLLRAFWVENCQSMMAAASLRSRSSAATSRLSNAASPTRRFRHCLLKTLNSISAMFNQLP